MKYPRTKHLPFSPGTTNDDKILNDLKPELLEWIDRNLLDIKFDIGTKMYWAKTNLPAYEKIAEDEWVNLDSTYIEEIGEGKNIEFILKSESEKPLYRNGKLNRFGFKWPDEMVYNYYKNFMKFEL